jgi:hypothetical protein
MKRLIAIAAGLVLVIGLVVAPFILFRPESYRKPLIDKLSAAFHHPVLIGVLEGHYFPPHMTLRNVSVLKAGDARYVSVDEAQVFVGWSALFGAKPEANRVELSGAHVVISRLPNGSWDYSEWLSGAPGASGAGGRPSLSIKKSDVRWVDAYAPAPAELQVTGLDGQWSFSANTLTLNGQLAGPVVPSAVSFQTKGPLGTGDWTGDAKLTENGRTVGFHLLRQSGLWQVTAESPEWRLDQAVGLARFYFRFHAADSSVTGSSFLRNWKAQYTSIGSSATLTHSAGLDGGTTELKGQVTDGMVSQVSFTAALQNVPVGSLKPILGSLGEGVDGKLTGVVSSFEAPMSSAAWSSAHGAFTLELANGSYRFPDSTLQTLKKVKTARYLRKKFPEFDDKGFPFSLLRVEGSIDHGGLTLHKAGLVSGDVRAAAVGRLEPVARSFDLWLQLQIHEILPSLRKELPERYVFGEPGQEKIQPIFGHMQGVWSEWKLRAAPRSKVPGAAQKHLRDGLSV